MKKNWRKIKFLRLISFLCLSLFLLAACQRSTVPENENFELQSLESEPGEVTIVLIQHDSCPWSYFWCTVEQGISDAAKDFNVKVITKRPDRGNYIPEKDTEKQQELFDEALEQYSDVDGIGVTLITKDLLKKSINRALEKNIEVIAYNSGHSPEEDDINYSMYIGQDDREAGYEAGSRLAEKIGLAKRPEHDCTQKNLLPQEGKIKSKKNNKIIRGVCINQSPTAENLAARCDGFDLAMCEYGVEFYNIPTKIDPEEIETDINKDYDNHEDKFDTKIFLSLGPIGAAPFYNFATRKGFDKEGKEIAHGIFDLSKTILDRIGDKADDITDFAVDQQPYLQGYLVVQWLAWKKRHKFEPYFEQGQNRVMSTGPYFIDKSNLKKVGRQVGQYR